jgi:hypothetical protein
MKNSVSLASTDEEATEVDASEQDRSSSSSSSSDFLEHYTDKLNEKLGLHIYTIDNRDNIATHQVFSSNSK